MTAPAALAEVPFLTARNVSKRFGACTAYFLTCGAIDVLVVERTEVAAAASGNAGEFLTLDWCTGTPLDALACRSVELHTSLAGEIGSDWAYKRMTAHSGPSFRIATIVAIDRPDSPGCPTVSSSRARSVRRTLRRSFIRTNSPPPS
jgi:glycine/D-amino acid oxidase-like deaminating enzyme